MFSTLLFVTLVFAVNADPIGPRSNDFIKRIVAGKDATITEFPYQVSIEWYGWFTCGGSILSPYYILTAGHCVHQRGSADAFTVRAGSSLSGEGGSLHHVVDYKVHEKYYVNEFENTGFDVAVMKLKEPIKFDSKRQPISLLESDVETKPGSVALASGWGSTKFLGGPTPKQLQSVNLSIISKEECLKSYKNFGSLEEGEICATYTGTNTRQSVCTGDSGGPLVVDGKLVGITAHGEDCSNLVYPNVFTEVAHFRKWIDEHVEY